MALIYIVEDDESIKEIEEYALKNAGHSVVGFSSAKSFYKRLAEAVPDLLIVDVMLPDENGNEIVSKLRRSPATKRLPIIMVTAKTTELDLVKGLENGADDYIKKPFSVMELVLRVKAMLRRVQPADDKIIEIGEILINNERHEVSIDGRRIELTYKEYELLQYLAINSGVVLTRSQIMDKVWNADPDVWSRTLDMHIKTLRQKLGDSGKRIRTVRNVGYEIE